MVIDSSALIAILQDEPERRAFNEAIEAAESCAMSTASFLETSMIVESRYGPDGTRDLDLFISKARITFASVDADQAHVARDAFRRYGKGRHSAGLNFGLLWRICGWFSGSVSLSLSILQEPVEASAGGIKGTLLLLGGTVRDERSPFFVDHGQQQLGDRAFAQRGVFMQVSDDFAAESPQIIAVHAQGLA